MVFVVELLAKSQQAERAELKSNTKKTTFHPLLLYILHQNVTIPESTIWHNVAESSSECAS
jgi:hypothetical protein